MELNGFIVLGLAGFLFGWGLELLPLRWQSRTEWILGAAMVVFALVAPRGAEDGFGPFITMVLLFGVAAFAFTRWVFNRRRDATA